MENSRIKGKVFFDLADNEVYFNTEKEVKISDLIESLKALDRIAGQSGPAFSQLLGVGISGVDVFVQSLEAGSLKERVLVRFFFENEEELDKFLAKWRGKMKELGPMKGSGIACGVVLAGMVTYGLFLVATRPGPSQQTNIDFSNSDIVIVGADSFEASPETFRMAIESAGTDKKALAKESLRFIKPALNAGGDVIFDGQQGTIISEKIIQSTPRNAVSEPDKLEEPYNDIDLQIRATDVDSRTAGWAGVIQGLADRRLPLVIAEDVDVTRMARNSTIRADVTLLKKFDARMSGEKYRPYKIIVERLVQPEEIE